MLHRLTYFQGGDELTERDDEKVKVEEELELLVEHEWEEAQDRVFLVSNEIRWVGRSGCCLSVSTGIWMRTIETYT